MKTIIEIKNLKKNYPHPHGDVVIFDELNLSIEENDFVSIIGPSGCGKTTFLNLISTIDSKYDGEILFKGKNLSKMTEQEKDEFRLKNIGYIFQFDSLIDDLTVIENILLPQMILDGKDDREKAIKKLSELGIEKISQHPVYLLSGGEKQRVCIARALINNPKIIIADEPTGNLDEKNAEIVMNDLRRMNENGITIIMASHNLDIVKRFSKKIYKIENKKMIRYEM